MTGPVIPADQWPDWAAQHCWDENGCGEFYGVLADTSAWIPVYEYSDIPIPGGHDWRVPTMRPGRQAPAIDLEQFREAVRVAQCVVDGVGDATLSSSECARLLALIDGQPNDNGVRVDRGALQMALNVLRRAGKDEVADELAGGVIDGQAVPRPLAEWHEDFGPVTWWAWRGSDWAGEPAWCGTPNDGDWPGYHTHWTPHPAMPMQPSKGEGE